MTFQVTVHTGLTAHAFAELNFLVDLWTDIPITYTPFLSNDSQAAPGLPFISYPFRKPGVCWVLFKDPPTAASLYNTVLKLPSAARRKQAV